MRRAGILLLILLSATLGSIRGQEMNHPQPSSSKQETKSDREKLDLKGPVRACKEQRSLAIEGKELSSSSTTEFTPEGRIVGVRNKGTDGSEWITTRTYDCQGHLLTMASGPAGTPMSQTTYTYDNHGRLVKISSDASLAPETSFQYDDRGRKTKLERFAKVESKPNVASTGFPWDDSGLRFSPPSEGTLITVYDERDVPTSGELRDAQGQLVGRLIRVFDASGHVIEERQELKAAERNLPSEFTSNLNEAQQRAIGAWIAKQFSAKVSYSYDPHGRVIEKRETMRLGVDRITKFRYNQNGDVEEELLSDSSARDDNEYSVDTEGKMIAVPRQNSATPAEAPTSSKMGTHYAYEYDSFGNWTLKTVLRRTNPDEAWTVSETTRREITYY